MKSPISPRITGFSAWKLYATFYQDTIGVLGKVHDRYGPAVAIQEWLPWRKRNRWCVVLSGAENNRKVLGDPDSYQSSAIAIRGRSGSILSRLNRGLIGMNGEEHRRQRRLVTPLFTPKAVSEYYQQMVEIVSRKLDVWPTGETIDVAQLVSHISLQISSCNFLRGDLDQAMLLGKVFEEHLRRSYSLGVLMMPLNLPGTPFRRLMRHAEKVAQHLENMIDRRQASAEDHHDLLGRLIEIHQTDPTNMPRETLLEQIAVLFAASHETVSKAVSWSLFLLAQHPQVMAELDQELRGTLGSAPPSFDDLQRLPLLDAVTKEAMRLFPPVPWAARKIRTETELAGIPVQHRDYVILSHFVTHRSPDVFPQPLKFRPRRWFDSKVDSYAYIPFSAGPRTCIGKVLGNLVINLMVGMIVQRFRLTVVPNSRIDRTVHVTLAPKHGLPMVAVPQDRRFESTPIRGNVHQMVDLSAPHETAKSVSVRFPRDAPKRESRRAA